MSDEPQPPNPFNPFGPGGFDFSQLFAMLGDRGPVNWEIARHIALLVAQSEPDDTDDFATALTAAPKVEPPIDPTTSEHIGALVRAALPRVVDVTGRSDAFALPVLVIGRVEWANRHLDALRTVLEAFARALESSSEQHENEAMTIDELGANPSDPFGGLLSVLAPVLLGFQAGSMIGQLARTSLGRYDLPLPTSDQPSIVIVAPNVDTFEAEWSLDRDDVRFAVVVHEVVHAAIRTVPWLLDRLVELATAYAAAYRVDPNAIESAIGSVDPADPASYSNLAADPTVLLGAMQSPEQIGIRARLQLLMSVVEGYADVVIAKVATPLIPSYPQIHEAVKRHRLDRGDAGAMIEALLGIELDREHYEQGEAFCTGVIERAGLDGLNRLWTSVEMLPTPNELAAPGLWLARIDLPLDDDADATDPAGPSTPPDPPA